MGVLKTAVLMTSQRLQTSESWRSESFHKSAAAYELDLWRGEDARPQRLE